MVTQVKPLRRDSKGKFATTPTPTFTAEEMDKAVQEFKEKQSEPKPLV